MSSVIEAIRTFVSSWDELQPDSPVWISSMYGKPVEYDVEPSTGNRVLMEFITGDRVLEYPFLFRSKEYNESELERIGSITFYEAFAEWLYNQTQQGNFPVLPNDKTPEKIEAVSWGYLVDEAGGVGLYQISCRLIYQQKGE